MRALSIRQPHAEAIMRGIKKIEFRSIRTHIRERIYIYAALGRYNKKQEARLMKRYRLNDVGIDELSRGVLVGTVELYRCAEGDEEFNWYLRKPERAKRMRKPKRQPQPVWFKPF